jgi:hypothetical protein
MDKRRKMKTKRLFLAAMIFAGASSLALAQHGGHSGGGGYAGHDQSMEGLQKKMKVQATEEQRTQLRTCSELSERLRMLAADMEKPSNLSTTDLGRVRQQWSGLLLQAMQDDHQAFMGSLNADQQVALKDRLRKMDNVWSELASRFETMDRDLTQTAPDAKLFAGHAKELEKSLKKWQKQHRDLASEIGIQS